MKIIEAKLIERIKRTESIESFRFSTAEKLPFSAGQFMRVIFNRDNLEDKELNKYLSLSCSPNKSYVEVTKRLSDSRFSAALKALTPGDSVFLNGPLGNCTLREDYKKIAFLIGGIGITPVVSILEYIFENKLDIDSEILYSNKNENDIAFKNELDTWSKINKAIKICYLVSETKPKDGATIFGRIDKGSILERITQLKERLIFIFGPPKMVEAMKALVLELGVKPENLKTESFIGY